MHTQGQGRGDDLLDGVNALLASFCVSVIICSILAGESAIA